MNDPNHINIINLLSRTLTTARYLESVPPMTSDMIEWCAQICHAMPMNEQERGQLETLVTALMDEADDNNDASLNRIAELEAYTDKLAAGLPDGMLPADVENLRKANAELAQQVHELKAEVASLTPVSHPASEPPEIVDNKCSHFVIARDINGDIWQKSYYGKNFLGVFRWFDWDFNCEIDNVIDWWPMPPVPPMPEVRSER